MKTAGIDGCKAGWILITFDKGEEAYQIIRKDEELKAAFQEYDKIFIDIPIGLKDETYTRLCDELLKKKLGPEYAPSVFYPPIRPALHAPTYAEANIESFEYTGKKLSLQAWNITPKIKTVDRLLEDTIEFREKVLESHPELIFMNLNGGMIYQKKNTKKGIRHRLELISEREAKAVDFFREIKEEYRRNEVEESDIVDSMALAYAAKASESSRTRTLPDQPEIDSNGLKMAIHYI
jgi:predicted RNase H-like nuclease